jgi:hypothetical protein
VLDLSIPCSPPPKARDARLIRALVCTYENQAPSQNHLSEETIAGSRSRASSRFAIVLFSIIFSVTTAAHHDLARADDCLAAPNSPAPKGSHWFYHLNRATQQKCWYVRPVERQPQDETVQTSSPNAALAPTNADQVHSTGREIHNSARQPEPVVAAADEPRSSNVRPMQVAAAGPETPLSTADPRPTAPTTIWPDPPPTPPSIQVQDAGAATASPDSTYSDADAYNSASRKDERTSMFDIPIGVFPAFAFGLVVLCFSLRFLMRCAAARSAQEIVSTEDFTKSTHVYATLSGKGPADEPANFCEDDFQSLVSPASGRGALERIVSPVRFANDIGAREARLAQLRENIGQSLGCAKPELQHSSRHKLAS